MQMSDEEQNLGQHSQLREDIECDRAGIHNVCFRQRSIDQISPSRSIPTAAHQQSKVKFRASEQAHPSLTIYVDNFKS